MRKALAILSVMLAITAALAAGNSLPNRIARPAANDVGKAHNANRFYPLSEAGPQAPVGARLVSSAPQRITPVEKGPAGTDVPTALDWATYMHDSCHTCAIAGNAASNLTQAWEYISAGGGVTAFVGSPVESDNTICFTSSDGYLYAVNRNTGLDAWAPVLLGYSGYRGGTPCIWQDRIAVAMVTGTGATSSVFCRKLSDGTSLWSTAIPNTPGLWSVYLSRPIVLTVSGTPYVFLGCYYGTAAPFTTRILGLNMTTGAIVYDQQWTGNRIVGGLATDGTSLYAPFFTSGLTKLTPASPPNFTTVWTQIPGPGMAEPYGVRSTPAYCNGLVFVAKGGTAVPNESLYAVNATTGAVRWIQKCGTNGLDIQSPAVDANNVYMLGAYTAGTPYTSMVFAFDQITGNPVWTTPYTTPDGICDGSMAITTGTNKRLYFSTGFGSAYYGHVYVLNASDGTLQQDVPYANDYLYNSVCRPYGGLYALSYYGYLVGYTVSDAVPNAADVGVQSITTPAGVVNPGTSIAPSCVIANFGTSPQSNIPVYCWIDSGAIRVQTSSYNYVGPLAPGNTAPVTLTPNWTVGPAGNSYTVTMFTDLSGEQTRSNDTAHGTAFSFAVSDTLRAPFKTAAVTLDGNIQTGEWSDALKWDVSDVLGEEGTGAVPPGSAFLYVKHDSSYVYYAMDVPANTTRLDYDQVGCYVDENYNRAWASDSSEGNHWFLPINGQDTTLYRSEPSYWIRWFGTPPNGACRSSLTSGHLQFEAQVSKATNKWDYTLSNPECDTVGFYTYATAGPSGGDYAYGHWPTTMPGSGWNDPTQYGTLILLGKGAGVVHDVGCTKIIEPFGSYVSGTSVTPACSVYNYGNVTEASYTVKMTIATPTPYTASATVTSHNPGTYKYASFTSWPANPVGGPYAVTCSTELTTDVVRANDKRTGSVTVTSLPNDDVGCTKILAPNPLFDAPIDSGTVVTPACSVYNYGSQTETFNVRMKIGAAYDQTAQVSGLNPAATAYVEFTTWTARPRGALAVSCSTELSGDATPANDKVTGSVTVQVYDMGVVAIVAPTGTVPPPGYITPSAKVHNWGTGREGCNVTFLINSTPAYTHTLGFMGGLPLADTVVVFPGCTLANGSYVAKCSTCLSPDPADQVPGNNVLSNPFTVGAPSETGWVRKADLPLGPKSKRVKDGGCLAAYEPTDDTTYIYAFKGNNRYEFYRYNATSNTWNTKESIPAIGRLGKKKAVKKGAAMTAAADDKLYAAKGNNCLEFWQYSPTTDAYPWSQMADVPTGAKNVKEGTGAVSFRGGLTDSTWVYFLKGSGTQEFYRYNPMPNLWETMTPAPLGASNKTWKNGSCLAYDGANTIYALKGSYNELFSYSCSTNAWTNRASLPLIGTGGKKKKVKDGAGLAYHAGHLYAQKGGNTFEFWTYAADSDRWAQGPDVPMGTGKKVKGGGALVYASGPNALYEFKGNNTLDFFKYGFSTYTLPLGGSTQGGVMTASLDAQHSALRIAPNPFSGTTTISFSLPKPGNASLRLYDVTGKLVNTLASGYHNAGTSSFIVPRSSLSSGIYMLKLESGGFTTTNKIIIE